MDCGKPLGEATGRLAGTASAGGGGAAPSARVAVPPRAPAVDESSRNGVAIAVRGGVPLHHTSRVLVGDKLFRLEIPT
jgi:hypothetical protein